MKTHFVFNKQTGVIVHIHFSDEGQDTSKEGILHNVDSSQTKKDLEILSLANTVEPGSYSVDVEKKILVKEKAKEDLAFGFARLHKPTSVLASKNVKTVYKKVKR